MTVIEKEVEALERQGFEAQVKKDCILPEKVVADDLVHTRINGTQDNQMAYTRSIRDGTSQYAEDEVKTMSVRAHNTGRTAAVNGAILITRRRKPGGSANPASRPPVVVQVKAKKGWWVVLWQPRKLISQPAR